MRKTALLSLFITLLVTACTNQEAHNRVTACKIYGVTDSKVLEQCETSWESYRSIVDPLKKQRRAKEIQAYNKVVEIFSNYERGSTSGDKKYQKVTIKKMNENYQDWNHKEAVNFGKRFLVSGRINFWGEEPEDFGYFTLEQTNKNGQGSIDVDIESLGREQRRLLREFCWHSDNCRGDVYGVIGPLYSSISLLDEDIGLRAEKIVLHPISKNDEIYVKNLPGKT